MYEGVDTTVLYEELAYEDVLPLTWRPSSASLLEQSEQFADRNLRVLQACAALDEHGQVEKPDEKSPHAADILRLDMKMNLLLDLVGRILVANQPRPAAVNVRFNAVGAIWRADTPQATSYRAGTQGLLEIYLRDCLVEPLRLFGTIDSVANDGFVKARFRPPGEAIGNLIEKLAFQRHRRQVADSKKPSGKSDR